MCNGKKKSQRTQIKTRVGEEGPGMLGQGRMALVMQVSSAGQGGPTGQGGSEPALSEGLSQSPGGERVPDRKTG